METLKEKTAKGLFWGGMNNGVQQLLGLAFGIILARLLDASDYGMTAMLAIFSVIANELQSSGFKTGLINLKAPTHKDFNAVFWFNIIAGAVIYLILFFCAPLIADYCHQPKLIPLSRYVFLGFVFSSFNQFVVYFERVNINAAIIMKRIERIVFSRFVQFWRA